MTSARRQAERAFKTKEISMEREINMEDMEAQIKELEKQLLEMKRVYRERKMAGLKSAMDARKSAEEAVKEELKALGIDYSYSRNNHSWTGLDPFIPFHLSYKS